MLSSVFNKALISTLSFLLLVGIGVAIPGDANTTRRVEPQAATDPNGCKRTEVYNEEFKTCVLNLSDNELNDLQIYLTDSSITNEDLAARIVAEYDAARANPETDKTPFDPKAQATKTGDPDYSSKKYSRTSTIVIPSIQVSAPIVYSSYNDVLTLDWASINSPMRKKLAKGVLHTAGLPEPGDKGNTVLVGHSSAYYVERSKYSTIFARLNKVPIGDTFEVRNSDGKVYKYKVFESFEYNFSNAISNNPSAEATAQAQKRNNRFADDSVITLETCWPVGTNKDRWVVQARLIK